MPKIGDMTAGALLIKRKKVQQELVLPIEFPPGAASESGHEQRARRGEKTNDAHMQHRDQVQRD